MAQESAILLYNGQFIGQKNRYAVPVEEYFLKETDRKVVRRMELKLNAVEQELLDLLLVIPPDLKKAEKILASMTTESITKVAINYAERCCMEDPSNPEVEDPGNVERIVSGLNSTYIAEVTGKLLELGADPNVIFETEYSSFNLMESLVHIDNGYLAADALALAMEHGGNPNLVVDEASLFDMLDFDVWFGAVEQYNRQRYAAWVHEWMVLLAYGGQVRDRENSIRCFREYNAGAPFDLSKLKKHRNFYMALSVENNERVLHIYDKQTLWEVASTKSVWTD